ncbi:MAG: PIN domain-containing protein [candidate division WOR-3 bacterium]
MVEQRYITDTHPIIWFLAKDKKLSRTAHRLFSKAEKSEVEIIVPTIVLAELLYISEKGKAPTELSEVLNRILEGAGFTIVPFDLKVFEAMLKMPKKLDIHDRIIGATSLVYNADVITKDKELMETKLINVAW